MSPTFSDAPVVAADPDLADVLARCCGADHVRPGGAGDAVDGVPAALVVAPASTAEVAAVMRATAAAGAAVVVRGAGTKLDWGAPPAAVDVVIETGRMNAVLEHAAGDLVVRVQPAVTLSALAASLAPARQRLGVDEVVPGSTVGGVLATGLSGPCRLSLGAVRDLVLGVTVVLADGTTARSGGKVVKNVAGYDLGKLYTGSYGTLGVIVEAILRLHPIPEATSWVVATYPDVDTAGAAAAAVVGSQAVPAGVEVDSPRAGGPVAVAAAVEGSPAGVEERAERVARLLGPGSRPQPSAPPWWGALPGPAVIKVTAEIAAVPEVMAALPVPTRASAGSGVVHAGVPAGASAGELADLVGLARRVAATAGGSAVVLRAPAGAKAGVDVWGPVGALGLMRRVKDIFDPDHRLARGRFVGGM